MAQQIKRTQPSGFPQFSGKQASGKQQSQADQDTVLRQLPQQHPGSKPLTNGKPLAGREISAVVTKTANCEGECNNPPSCSGSQKSIPIPNRWIGRSLPDIWQRAQKLHGFLEWMTQKTGLGNDAMDCRVLQNTYVKIYTMQCEYCQYLEAHPDELSWLQGPQSQGAPGTQSDYAYRQMHGDILSLVLLKLLSMERQIENDIGTALLLSLDCSCPRAKDVQPLLPVCKAELISDELQRELLLLALCYQHQAGFEPDFFAVTGYYAIRHMHYKFYQVADHNPDGEDAFTETIKGVFCSQSFVPSLFEQLDYAILEKKPFNKPHHIIEYIAARVGMLTLLPNAEHPKIRAILAWMDTNNFITKEEVNLFLVKNIYGLLAQIYRLKKNEKQWHAYINDLIVFVDKIQQFQIPGVDYEIKKILNYNCWLVRERMAVTYHSLQPPEALPLVQPKPLPPPEDSYLHKEQDKPPVVKTREQLRQLFKEFTRNLPTLLPTPTMDQGTTRKKLHDDYEQSYYFLDNLADESKELLEISYAFEKKWMKATKQGNREKIPTLKQGWKDKAMCLLDLYQEHLNKKPAEVWLLSRSSFNPDKWINSLLKAHSNLQRFYISCQSTLHKHYQFNQYPQMVDLNEVIHLGHKKPALINAVVSQLQQLVQQVSGECIIACWRHLNCDLRIKDSQGRCQLSEEEQVKHKIQHMEAAMGCGINALLQAIDAIEAARPDPSVQDYQQKMHNWQQLRQAIRHQVVEKNISIYRELAPRISGMFDQSPPTLLLVTLLDIVQELQCPPSQRVATLVEELNGMNHQCLQEADFSKLLAAVCQHYRDHLNSLCHQGVTSADYHTSKTSLQAITDCLTNGYIGHHWLPWIYQRQSSIIPAEQNLLQLVAESKPIIAERTSREPAAWEDQKRKQQQILAELEQAPPTPRQKQHSPNQKTANKCKTQPVPTVTEPEASSESESESESKSEPVSEYSSIQLQPPGPPAPQLSPEQRQLERLEALIRVNPEEAVRQLKTLYQSCKIGQSTVNLYRVQLDLAEASHILLTPVVKVNVNNLARPEPYIALIQAALDAPPPHTIDNTSRYQEMLNHLDEAKDTIKTISHGLTLYFPHIREIDNIPPEITSETVSAEGIAALRNTCAQIHKKVQKVRQFLPNWISLIELRAQWLITRSRYNQERKEARQQTEQSMKNTQRVQAAARVFKQALPILNSFCTNENSAD